MDRPRGIGGSDAAAVVGLDPYRSPAYQSEDGRVKIKEVM